MILRSVCLTGSFLRGNPLIPVVLFFLDSCSADFLAAARTYDCRISFLGTGGVYGLLLALYVMAKFIDLFGHLRAADLTLMISGAVGLTGGFLRGNPLVPVMALGCDCRSADFLAAARTYDCRISFLGTGGVYGLLLALYVMAKFIDLFGHLRAADLTLMISGAVGFTGGFLRGNPLVPVMTLCCDSCSADFLTTAGANDCRISNSSTCCIYGLLLALNIMAELRDCTGFLCITYGTVTMSRSVCFTGGCLIGYP